MSVKLQRVCGSNTRIVSIRASLIKEAGVDPKENDLRVNREAKNGKIILEFE